MATPDRTRNRQVLALMVPMEPAEPVRNTIIHENTRTTAVRTAVAKSESVSLTPIFDKTAVRPANTAEPNANNSHSIFTSPIYSLYPVLPYGKSPHRKGETKTSRNAPAPVIINSRSPGRIWSFF